MTAFSPPVISAFSAPLTAATSAPFTIVLPAILDTVLTIHDPADFTATAAGIVATSCAYGGRQETTNNTSDTTLVTQHAALAAMPQPSHVLIEFHVSFPSRYVP